MALARVKGNRCQGDKPHLPALRTVQTEEQAGGGQVSSPGLDGLCNSRGTTRGKCPAGSRVGEAPGRRDLHIASVQGMKEKLKRQIILQTLESSWTPCLGNSKSSCMRASSFLWIP